MAPDFEFDLADGQKARLSDWRGKTVVLYFYPKDNTPGCTAQACDLRDNHQELLEKGLAVIGVSPDSLASHGKFSQKFGLPFPLVADTDTRVAEAYGVWGEKKMYGKTYMGINRTTFVIGPDGQILKVIAKVDTKAHSRQVLDALGR